MSKLLQMVQKVRGDKVDTADKANTAGEMAVINVYKTQTDEELIREPIKAHRAFISDIEEESLTKEELRDLIKNGKAELLDAKDRVADDKVPNFCEF